MVNVSKTFPPHKQVLKNIYLSFFYGAKIGIIGLNGSGKSTLMKIIAGIEKSFQGEVVFSPGYSVGYLEQEPKFDEDKTVKEVVQEGVAEIMSLLQEFEAINIAFGDPDADFDKLVNWNVPWMRFVVLMKMRLCVTYREVNVVVWRCVVCYCKNLMFYCLMNLPTTLMRKVLIGWNNIYNNMRERLLPSPTTVIFWIMWLVGFWN